MPAYYFIPKKLVKRLPFLQRSAWWLEYVFFKLMATIVRALPLATASALLAAMFSLYGPHTNKAARVRRNLQFVLPGQSDRQAKAAVKAVFGNLGRATAELIQLDKIWARRATQLEFVATEKAENIMRSGQPAVMVSAHVGAWQLTNLVGAHYGFGLSTIYAAETNPYLEPFFRRLRSGFKTGLIPSEGGVRQLLRELKSGNSVGLAVDTRLDSGEMLPFFGVATPTNTVPARLALSANCPLLVVRAQRLSADHFRISTCDPIEAEPTADTREAQALSITAQLNALFEQWIREEPTQWICLKRRWPKDANPGLSSA